MVHECRRGYQGYKPRMSSIVSADTFMTSSSEGATLTCGKDPDQDLGRDTLIFISDPLQSTWTRVFLLVRRHSSSFNASLLSSRGIPEPVGDVGECSWHVLRSQSEDSGTMVFILFTWFKLSWRLSRSIEGAMGGRVVEVLTRDARAGGLK